MQFEHRQESLEDPITQAKFKFDEPLPIRHPTALGASGKPRLYDGSILFKCRRHLRPKELMLKRHSVGCGRPAKIRLRKILLRDLLEEQKTRGPMTPCLYMHYGDVRTAYRHKIADSRKHNDAAANVKLWLDSIQEEGGKSMFIDDIKDFEHIHIMADNKGTVCMDSAHRTVKSLNPDPKDPRVHGAAYLFTVLVKDRQLRSGISTASMVFNSESIMLLKKWLTWLKTDYGLQATKFM
ncbi:hypothetical protein BGZ47_003923, partial [Haplosporangium gracile]